MELTLDKKWQERLEDELSQDYFKELWQFVTHAYDTSTIYPPIDEVFTAFNLTPFNDVRVVILGQDPYHGENQAHGLSFSVKEGVTRPPSLRNMVKELEDDLDLLLLGENGNLTSWAQQGVFLLNTVLTVEAGKANSHSGKGWERFTDAVIRQLGEREEPIIFVLWGKQAQVKKRFINKNKHVILTAPHPSPLSSYRGFFGSKPYSSINNQLKSWGQAPINWEI
ncbi:uracil-DNA glycosylase [Vagococcus xieshaowenii]|uniref:Uracil-DNA glycosylase n=1 Tax=Vagococcus xieshaowenii TaxID=2562451 RepID=A0A4Z0D0S6_9ENTE|nr:uracil-DNA glycosylase [Vagococcus xieshaowenii]QCA29379.1 uracil-DNA glycosylase [Vagococcus xieshaowenii]TFZ39330.1 uracil-DNA glycosylase [Vagococcus xieshaowenii]